MCCTKLPGPQTRWRCLPHVATHTLHSLVRVVAFAPLFCTTTLRYSFLFTNVVRYSFERSTRTPHTHIPSLSHTPPALPRAAHVPGLHCCLTYVCVGFMPLLVYYRTWFFLWFTACWVLRRAAAHTITHTPATRMHTARSTPTTPTLCLLVHLVGLPHALPSPHLRFTCPFAAVSAAHTHTRCAHAAHAAHPMRSCAL